MLYKKKPIPLEANQWFKHGDHKGVGNIPADHPMERYSSDPSQLGWIETLEGGYIVSPGDWIVTGTRGEHWAVKPEIFAETYELA